MTRPLKLMYLAGTQDPHTALRLMRAIKDDPSALFVPQHAVACFSEKPDRWWHREGMPLGVHNSCRGHHVRVS